MSWATTGGMRACRTLLRAPDRECLLPTGTRTGHSGMRAVGYDRSEILGSEVTVLNATSALYRGAFSRQHSDLSGDRRAGGPPHLSAGGS
jgi:hypothetical protein